MRQLEILIAVSLVSAACSLLGPFLILRKMSMMIDSITHTILLGIVIAFFITKDLTSPLLIVGAGLVGILTVFLTELINQKTALHEDASIGLVFPFLFSIAIIIISKFLRGVHLCIDSVLVGEVAFSVIPRIEFFGYEGSKVIFVMAVIFLIDLIFIGVFFKELKISTFDKNLSLISGFAPAVIYYALMSLVSITTVGAFNAVGSILVISYMVVPSACAYLLTHDLKKMIVISVFVGVLSSVLGFYCAYIYDLSIAGTIAVVNGIIFFLVFIFEPRNGIIRKIVNESRKRTEFAEVTMLLHIINHENTENEKVECNISKINEHLCYAKNKFEKVLKSIINKKLAYIDNDIIKVTDMGREKTLNKFDEWMK
ncbi:ABC 3 transport family protein [Parvimonas sp. KA00067]|uniref:metal ABC transporter permease n=1 Tax=Parvimonas sp. KA00067 TaxID=1588755 RepID=UPI000796C5A5|nr:metal ABC transporter permease [Parvimonas sp. KA00067]KXB65726.1 ABC 3 transport family protein [Parvimonas sp. KA00067]